MGHIEEAKPAPTRIQTGKHYLGTILSISFSHILMSIIPSDNQFITKIRFFPIQQCLVFQNYFLPIHLHAVKLSFP